MRVLVIGERYPDSFADNVVTALGDAGHDARHVSPFRRPIAGGGPLRSRMKAELPAWPRLARGAHSHVLEAVEEARPDLVLNLDFRVAWGVVRELRRQAVTAFWFPDPVGYLGREMHVLADYHAIFVKDSTLAARYRRLLGLDAHYLAEACNPRWHRPPEGVTPGDAGPALLLAGNMYATRFALLARLQSVGVQVEIHGPRWPRWLPDDVFLRRAYSGRYLARETKASAFRAATAVLNTMTSHEADGANCRLFEAAGCGAVVLTEFRDRIPELFDVEREVRSYADFDGLVERAREIAALPPTARRALGDAAAARAHRDHGYAQRFDEMTGVLGRG